MIPHKIIRNFLFILIFLNFCGTPQQWIEPKGIESKVNTGTLKIKFDSEDNFKYPFLQLRLSKNFPQYLRGLRIRLNGSFSITDEPLNPIVQDNISFEINGEIMANTYQFQIDPGEYYGSIDNGYFHDEKPFQPFSKTRSDYSTLILFGYQMDEDDFRSVDKSPNACEMKPFQKDFLTKIGNSATKSRSHCPKIKIEPNQVTEIHIKVSKNHLEKLTTFFIWIPLGIGLFPLWTGFTISSREVHVQLINAVAK